ncbi:MAG: hypothetical protein HKN68_01970 [Saprospiraceae bacterium]|nr:hypothetical protein [Saprospiraceae bacterium]
MRIIHLLTILICVFIFSCSNELDDKTAAVIEEDILIIEDSSVPKGITDFLDNSTIVLFGETHYVQEHQEFIVRLLPELSERGYKIIYQELFHCFTWMVEDYINGDINELPEFLHFFDDTLIRGLKSFNETVPEGARIELRYMDVNHWKSNFSRSIEEMEKIIGPSSLFDKLKNTIPDEADYLTNLISANNLMINDKQKYQNELGVKWYDRILEMIGIEIKSHNHRTIRNNGEREKVMAEIITLGINESLSSKHLINTGMFHAQKEIFMGQKIDRLRQLLDKEFTNLNSLVFIGMRGKYKNAFDSNDKITFDLTDDASSNSMINLIDKISENHMSFLPLKNDVFNDDVEINYTPETKVNAPIGQQFDAIITYPEIGVLESMDVYDYRK